MRPSLNGIVPAVVHRLLPSPAARDWKSSASNLIGTNARPLNEVIAHLLPTPTVNDSRGGRNQTATRTSPDSKHHDGRTLTDVMFAMDLTMIDWREYEPAIRRWGAVHGPAPFPAALGPKGGIKPSPAFVEWMMALPVGHVSSVPGLTINEMLKLLGNGVVPAQAEYAIRELTQGNEEVMSTNDTSSFFTTHQTRDVPRDQWGRYKLPGPDGEEMSYTRATTLAATLAEQYGLSIWKQRQVVWGLSRRPDLLTMATTIAGPEDKKALGAIVDEAHIAAGTQAKANKGSAIHRAIQAAENGAFDQVPEELRIHVSKYFAKMRENQLKIIPEYVERTVIIPDYDTAGTFDNLVRCPDGKIRVSDKKTGRMDYSDTEFAVQMALYANASAMFNYDTGRYEPMPEIAKDYAILVHIDPDTGHCELQDVNIEWGWVWARTCAQTMQIRKTKHVITPHIPPADNVSSPMPSVTMPALNHQDANIHGMAQRSLDSGTPLLAHNWVPDVPEPGVPIAIEESRMPTLDMTIFQELVRTKYGDTAQVSASRLADGSFTIVVDPSSLPDTQATPMIEYVNSLGAIIRDPLGHHAAPSQDFVAFWSNSEHDEEEPESLNGVPVAQYGQPNTWPCARGGACEFTGQDGLHTDGTVCLYGNARPGLIPPPSPAEVQYVEHQAAQGLTITEQTGIVAEDLGTLTSATESNVDDLIAKIDGLKGGKAAVQTVARRLMAKLGIKEGTDGAIKLNQYKIKVAKAIVTLAHANGVSIPGQKDGDPDFGTPTGPAPTDSASGTPAATKASAERSGEEVAREAQIKTAVEAIRMQTTLDGLRERHDYYVQTSIGWTEEMQNAARTRAAELDLAAGTTPLTPIQMIQGATSQETLAMAWQQATDGGTNLGGWTEEMNALAMAKQTELAANTAVATSGNQ